LANSWFSDSTSAYRFLRSFLFLGEDLDLLLKLAGARGLFFLLRRGYSSRNCTQPVSQPLILFEKVLSEFSASFEQPQQFLCLSGFSFLSMSVI